MVIGVHAPEFAFERNIDNVRQAVKDLKLDYPVAIDNNYAIWRAFNNQYWPAHYFIDAKGQIRHHHFGEGEYDQSEKVIQQLLAEAGKGAVPHDIVAVDGSGAEAAADVSDIAVARDLCRLPARRKLRLARRSRAGCERTSTPPRRNCSPNQWALGGRLDRQRRERHLQRRRAASIAYRFHARDLHLVLGPSSDGKPVRFRVLIDGKPPLADHGADVDAQGNGTIDGQRLYQLVRQSGPVADRNFEIEFLDPGAQAFAFTFG